jgi:hypothetical protein
MPRSERKDVWRSSNQPARQSKTSGLLSMALRDRLAKLTEVDQQARVGHHFGRSLSPPFQ